MIKSLLKKSNMIESLEAFTVIHGSQSFNRSHGSSLNLLQLMYILDDARARHRIAEVATLVPRDRGNM